jgi:uncharacterized protein YeaO (DUF488 family)
MTLQVHTSRINYGGPDRLDVTMKTSREAVKKGKRSPGAPFAPTQRLVYWGKNMLRIAEKKRLNGDRAADAFEDWAWQTYGQRYHMQMKLSYAKLREAWDELLARDRVVLVCFCVDPARCHRRLLAEYLEKCGALDRGELP